MKNKAKLFARIVGTLAVMQALAILGSWIASAVWPQSGLKSLLGNEGLRWLLSSFCDNVSSPYLVWFLLLSMLYGSAKSSGIKEMGRIFKEGNFRDRFAAKVFLFENFLGIFVCLIFAFYPHSLALGVTGELFPGPFLKICTFLLVTTFLFSNISFAFLAGNLKNEKDLEQILTNGIKSTAPLIVIYFLLKELVEMLSFVLG